MAPRLRAVVGLCVLALLLGGAVLAWRLPDRSFVALRDALASGDATAIEAHVDFDALREHLKRQLLDSFTRAAPDERIAMAASRYVGTLVDGLVTPASLARLGAGAALDDAEVRWRGFDGAEVALRAEDGRARRWQLARRGVSFVLVGIELPPELAGELERQWAARLAAGGPSRPEDVALITESGARACASWRKNALGILQALTGAQRAYHAKEGRYADDVSALDVPLVRGPDLYDFVVTRADERGFAMEARGKALMAGDVLVAEDRGIRVVRDLCARTTE